MPDHFRGPVSRNALALAVPGDAYKVFVIRGHHDRHIVQNVLESFFLPRDILLGQHALGYINTRHPNIPTRYWDG